MLKGKRVNSGRRGIGYTSSKDKLLLQFGHVILLLILLFVMFFLSYTMLGITTLKLLLGRQRGDLLLEQLLGLLPDTHVLPVLQTEQTGKQVGAESLRRLAGQQAG